jgi:UPF0271 protein
MYQIDLNSDLGESFGNYVIGNDEGVLDHISSANIACGFHASDPVVMAQTVRMAIEKGVSIGAHPGYPDLMGFGRRHMSISTEEAKAYMIYQIGALNGFVQAYGGKLRHVKPHGALYNAAAKDYALARALAESVHAVDQDLIFVGLAGSQMIKAAKDVGLSTASEVFADRAYNPDGSLVSRGMKGAVLHDVDLCISRVMRMIKEGMVRAINGVDIDIAADTVCLHGDNEMALAFASKLRQAFNTNKIAVRNFLI